METLELSKYLPGKAMDVVLSLGLKTLRPSQEKAVTAGVLSGRSVLVCTPTASGKTFIAELAALQTILGHSKKAVYIVPLVALANEKYKDFKHKYGNLFKIALAVGDYDRSEASLADADLIVCTSEKLDSVLRHKAPWLVSVGLVVVDEIHLLNDPSRGPTLEILLTILRSVQKDLQILGLSATIGNPEELSAWLGAELVVDTWRPTELKKGLFLDGELHF